MVQVSYVFPSDRVTTRKIAWTTPGTQKKTVRIRLIQKSLPRPDIKNIANVGSKIARMIRMMVYMICLLLRPVHVSRRGVPMGVDACVARSR